MNKKELAQQTYIDILYNFQCCIASKTIELKNLDEVGSDCYEEKFLDILKLTLIFKSLLCKDINSPECYTQEEIIKLLEILKFECNNCCSDIKGLKKQLL